MKQVSRTLWTALAGAAFLLTTGCQEQNPLTTRSKGALSFSVAWPKAAPSGFVIQAIPDQTQKINLRIEGEGLEAPLTRSVTRESGESSDNLRIDLPTGRKTVKAEALDAKGQVLAVDVRSVVIVGGQTQRLEMTLQPLGLPTPSPEPTVIPVFPPLPGNTSGSTTPPQTPSGLLPIPPSLPQDSTLPPSPAPVTTQPAPVAQPLPINPAPTESTTTSSSSTSSSSSSSSSSSTSDSPVVPTVTAFTPSNGLVGATVTLTGTNFNKVTGVAFNGTSALFTIVSDTQITATVPNGATTGGISLTTGSTSASTGTFTVNTQIENLRIQEVAAVVDSKETQYIDLKNTGTTAVNASGLSLYYTDNPTGTPSTKHFVIPSTPLLSPGAILTVWLNKNGTNNANNVYTGTLGYANLTYNPTQVSEVFLCKANPCTSTNILTYMAFGAPAAGANLALATGAVPALWTGNPRSLSNTQETISTGNFFPGDAGVGISLSGTPSTTFESNEPVVIFDASTGLKYSSTLTASGAVPPYSSIQITTMPKATISASNSGDSGLNGPIQVDSTASLVVGATVKVRSELHQITSLTANGVQFPNPLGKEAAPSNTGSGVADALNPTNNVIQPAGAPSTPASNLFVVNDLVTLKAKTTTQPGNGVTRTITASNANGFNINSAFAAMQFASTNTGSGGTSNVTMASSLPAGLSTTEQFWGGRDNQRFSIASFSSPNVGFNIDFVNCPISTGNTGTGAAGNGVLTNTCLTGSINLRVGMVINVNGSQHTITALPTANTVEFTPALATAPTSGVLKATPQSGNIDYIPYTIPSPPAPVEKKDILILTPRSGEMKLVPKGGAIIKKQALKLGTCGTTPDASCFNFGTLSH